MYLPPEKRLQLALLGYLLYGSGLEPNQGVLVNGLFTVDADLGHLAEVEFVRFLHGKVPLFVPLRQRIIWKDVLVHSPHLRSGESCSTSLKTDYVNCSF